MSADNADQVFAAAQKFEGAGNEKCEKAAERKRKFLIKKGKR